MPHEPEATALLLATCGLLLAISVLFSRASQRFGVPIALLFLGVGMLAGSEGIGGIEFDDYHFAFRFGMLALALILFDGGLNTPLSAVRRAAGPAGILATLGVAGTATLVAAAAHALGLGWGGALLLGAVVSSTDAAAVFAVLRGSGLQLKRRVGVTLEVESGINDPVAFILTTVLTQNLLTPGAAAGSAIPVEVVLQIVVGAAVGAAVGYGGRYLLCRLSLRAGGLYPVMTLSLGLLAFGVATLVHGSGFLAVYLAGLLLGNGPLPYRTGLLRVHDALAWLSQVGMFLILGLLVFPSRLIEAAPGGPRDRPAAGVPHPAAGGVRSACCRSGIRRARCSTSDGWGCGARCRSCWPPTRCWSACPARAGCSTWCSSSWWRTCWCRAATVAWVTQRLGLQSQGAAGAAGGAGHRVAPAAPGRADVLLYR